MLSKHYGNKYTNVDLKNLENVISVENASFALKGVTVPVLVNHRLRWRKP